MMWLGCGWRVVRLAARQRAEAGTGSPSFTLGEERRRAESDAGHAGAGGAVTVVSLAASDTSFAHPASAGYPGSVANRSRGKTRSCDRRW